MLKLNGKIIEIKKFPNNETLIFSDMDINYKVNIITLKFEGDEDLLNMMFLVNHLREIGIDNIELVMPYIPYSRMDRTEGKTVFTLKYICNLINNMGFKRVTVYEPHSDVSLALLDRVTAINMTALMAQKQIDMINSKKNDEIPLYIVYPDNGAMKRYTKQINHDKVLTCSKERDFETGYINKLTIDGELPTEPFKALIVDDLCSGGMTFILTAQKLREIGATEIALIVTHCEKTILNGEIFKTDLIDSILTTNSIINEDDEDIKGIVDTGRLNIIQII